MRLVLIVILVSNFNFLARAQEKLTSFNIETPVFKVKVHKHLDKKEVWFYSIELPEKEIIDTVYNRAYFSYYSAQSMAEQNIYDVVYFYDYNQDGYLDVKLSGGSLDYNLYIYDTINRAFVANYKLGYCHTFEINRNNNKLYGVSSPPCGTGGSYSDTTFWQIKDGRFIEDYHSNHKTTWIYHKSNRRKMRIQNEWVQYKKVDGKKVYLFRKKWKSKFPY